MPDPIGKFEGRKLLTDPVIFGPNITGWFELGQNAATPRVNGVFSLGSTLGGRAMGTQFDSRQIKIDASLASSIYSDITTTVQTASNQNLIIIKF